MRSPKKTGGKKTRRPIDSPESTRKRGSKVQEKPIPEFLRSRNPLDLSDGVYANPLDIIAGMYEKPTA